MPNLWWDRWLDQARESAATATSSDLVELIQRVDDSFLGRCVHRFLRMTGIDRSVALASQAFTALIPLLILVAALAPASQESLVADTMIRKFNLSGDAADAVTQLFAVPEEGAVSLSAFSTLLLVVSGTSFTRRMQRMYRSAWGEEKAGVRSGLYAALGLFVLIAEVFVLYFARALVNQLPLSWLLTLPISVITGAVLWTSIPFLLLNRQVHWRRLAFGGIVASIATSLYSVATTVYMPALIERYTKAFGLFGISTALIGWLLAVAVILVASAAIGAEFDASQARWVIHLKDRFHLEDPDRERPAPTPHDLAAGLRADDLRLLVRVLISWGLLTGAVWFACVVVPGIEVPGGLGTFLLVSLVLGLVNALIGTVPRLLLLPAPLVFVGMMSLVLNALLLMVTAFFSDGLEVHGFVTAVLASAMVAAASTLLGLVWSPIRHRL